MDNLPRYFALESLSNSKYLRYVHEDDAVLHRHVEFSGEEVISVYTKFELEPATNEGYSGLFNIRCCYNNKYWTRREKNKAWISATAAEPVEDQSKWSCTLFEPTIEVSDKDGKSTTLIRLRHVQPDRYVPVSVGSGRDPTYQSSLKAAGNPNTATAFSIIDWESFVILPKQVTFKGDDGRYLCCTDDGFQFDSKDSASLYQSHDVIYACDGNVRLTIAFVLPRRPWYPSLKKSMTLCLPEYFEIPETLLSLVKGHGDNEVAILINEFESFCQMVTLPEEREGPFLEATASTMVKETILRVEEPVVSRSVYNVSFRLEDSRIYDQFDVTLVRKQLSNPLGVDQIVLLSQTFTKETTRTWNSIVTLKLRTPTTIETSVPSIVDGEVDFSDEFEGRYEWGTDMIGSETTEFSDHINIPARSTVMVRVIATKGKCDVPFSYMQRDTRANGKVYINKMDDGVYTGVNYYSFKAEVVKTTLMEFENIKVCG